LREWLNSPAVAVFDGNANWPTPETAEIWRMFRESFSPAIDRLWSHRAYVVPVIWSDKQAALKAGTPAHAETAIDGKQTLIHSPDYEQAGSLAKPLNPARAGLVIATVNGNQTGMRLDYIGPNDLFAA
jgi:hypothetical protein